jgi:hypothetical protein
VPEDSGNQLVDGALTRLALERRLGLDRLTSVGPWILLVARPLRRLTQ